MLEYFEREPGFNRGVAASMLVGGVSVANGQMTDGCPYVAASFMDSRQDLVVRAYPDEATNPARAQIVRDTQKECLTREGDYHGARIVAYAMSQRGGREAVDAERGILVAAAQGLEACAEGMQLQRGKAQGLGVPENDILRKTIDTEDGLTRSRRLGVLAVLGEETDLDSDLAGGLLARDHVPSHAHVHAALRQLIACSRGELDRLDKSTWTGALRGAAEYPHFVREMHGMMDAVSRVEEGDERGFRLQVWLGLLSFVAWRP